MEGLEISIVNLRDVLAESPTFRVDSNYFQKEFLQSAVRQFPMTVGDVSTVKSGTTPPDREDSLKEGVVLLKTTNIRGNVLTSSDSSEFYYIAPAIAKRLAETKLAAQDVLINIVGATTDVIGRVAFVPDDFPEANITQAMALLRVNNARVKPGFLFALLLGKYGNQQVRRIARPTGQYNLNLPEVRSLKLPQATEVFQSQIEGLINQAHTTSLQIKQLYTQAETLLLEALGLRDWQPPEPLAYEQTSRAAFAAGRLDAEHFQPKYAAARQALRDKGAKRFVPLDDLLSDLTNGHTPLRHDLTVGEVPFLAAEHVGDFRVDYNSSKRILAEHHRLELARTALQNGDVLMTIKGRVGNAALVENLPGPVNINQDVARLQINSTLPLWFVLAFVNSPFGKFAVSEQATGQINPFLGLGNLRQISIPVFDEEFMQRIANGTRDKIAQAHRQQQAAKGLLEAARRAVEIAIEEDEAAALRCLEAAREA